MPLVIVTWHPSVIDPGTLHDLGKDIQSLVASTLSVSDEGGDLTETDIEVRFRQPGRDDINASNFSVEVVANLYPERVKNLDGLTKQIADALRKHPLIPRGLIGNETSFVWVLLCPAGFAFL